MACGLDLTAAGIAISRLILGDGMGYQVGTVTWILYTMQDFLWGGAKFLASGLAN
jgi:hypothetical protein